MYQLPIDEVIRRDVERDSRNDCPEHVCMSNSNHRLHVRVMVMCVCLTLIIGCM